MPNRNNMQRTPLKGRYIPVMRLHHEDAVCLTRSSSPSFTMLTKRYKEPMGCVKRETSRTVFETCVPLFSVYSTGHPKEPRPDSNDAIVETAGDGWPLGLKTGIAEAAPFWTVRQQTWHVCSHA